MFVYTLRFRAVTSYTCYCDIFSEVVFLIIFLLVSNVWTCAEPRISGSNEWPIPLYHFSNSVLFLGLLPKIPKTAIKISFCFKWIHFVRKAMFNIFTISLFQSYSWKNVVSIAIFYTPNILQLQMTVDSQKKEHEMSFFLKLFLTLLKSCNNVSILFLCLFSVKHRDSCLSMWTLVVLGIRTQWRLAATNIPACSWPCHSDDVLCFRHPGFGVLSVALASQAIILLTSLVEDLHVEGLSTMVSQAQLLTIR